MEKFVLGRELWNTRLISLVNNSRRIRRRRINVGRISYIQPENVTIRTVIIH
jgi:hypothetical protein